MSTYVFGIVVVGCILVQMVGRSDIKSTFALTRRQNYFNKALDTFSTNV